MTTTDLLAITPLIILSAASVVLLLVTAFYRNHKVIAVLALMGIALAFASLPMVSSEVSLPFTVTQLIILDGYALLYMGLLFAVSFVVILIAHGYLEKRQGNHEEFYILVLLATLGCAVLVASSHFASLFLGLEILSVSLYVLIAYLYTDERSIEAGLKYLVLAAVSSAFLLFGMALVYAELGTMEFTQMASHANAGNHSMLLLAGMGLMVVGIGFKLAVVPFHLWTPDVYEGAPAPVTAFVATASKGAVVALLMRYFATADSYAHSSLFQVFTVIAIASMFAGNLMALLQNNVKRILAYSSIAHLGYVLVAFIAFRADEMMAVTAVTFYLVAYSVTTLGAFGIITVLSPGDREADAIDDYRGLAWHRPWLAGIFTAVLLSLAGIPLTAGFVGKFYVVAAGVGSALWLLLVLLVVNSTIGLYYYLRIVVAMYRTPEDKAGEAATGLTAAESPTTPASLPLIGGVVLAGLTLLIVWLGVYPATLMRVIKVAVDTLV
ncbi:MAG: NADH-quinone oxidoreductase subunit N [Candidatus Poribacteria bacterium]|nr:NADH-quinone oxidoreductase subunit N [Candidatus Poribacteria bacterium]